MFTMFSVNHSVDAETRRIESRLCACQRSICDSDMMDIVRSDVANYVLQTSVWNRRRVREHCISVLRRYFLRLQWGPWDRWTMYVEMLKDCGIIKPTQVDDEARPRIRLIDYSKPLGMAAAR